MYHLNNSGNGLISYRTSFPPGLVLSTDAKPRLKWTAELHERFVEAVNQLGGPEKATPKTVMRFMGIQGLTLYHLKSHLQKYRLGKNLHAQPNGGGEMRNVIGHIAAPDRTSEGSESTVNNMNVGSHSNKAVKLSEALQMQIEVQRRLNEQLEVQRHLQMRIEAQGKYLQSVLENAEITLGKQNSATASFQPAKMQVSELVSKLSKNYPNTFTGSEEINDMQNLQGNITQSADSSIDSYLILRAYHNKLSLSAAQMEKGSGLEQVHSTWSGGLNCHKSFSQSMVKDSRHGGFPVERDSEGNMTEAFQREREEEEACHEQQGNMRAPSQQRSLKKFNECGLPYARTQLDLNAQDAYSQAPDYKEFDLNCFS